MVLSLHHRLVIREQPRNSPVEQRTDDINPRDNEARHNELLILVSFHLMPANEHVAEVADNEEPEDGEGRD